MIEAGPQPQSPAAGAARRTRPRGLSQLHQEQIEDSRNRILSAAEAAFTQNSYMATPVDMIISIAGVSRATFYKYFNSKFDLAKGLIDVFLPRLQAVFDQMPAQPDRAEAADWLRRLLRLYEENRQFTALLSEVGNSEPDFFPEMIAIHSALIARLGERIPAFRAAGAGPDSPAYVRAHLQIQHMFGFATCVVVRGWKIDVEAGLQGLAATLADFIAGKT
jgi:AcrR family transcriptional regulator